MYLIKQGFTLIILLNLFQQLKSRRLCYAGADPRRRTDDAVAVLSFFRTVTGLFSPTFRNNQVVNRATALYFYYMKLIV